MPKKKQKNCKAWSTKYSKEWYCLVTKESMCAYFIDSFTCTICYKDIHKENIVNVSILELTYWGSKSVKNRPKLTFSVVYKKKTFQLLSLDRRQLSNQHVHRPVCRRCYTPSAYEDVHEGCVLLTGHLVIPDLSRV